MTSSDPRVVLFDFKEEFSRGGNTSSFLAKRLIDWPVTYIIYNEESIYVGQTQNTISRMKQHLKNPAKDGLKKIRVILGNEFNRSVCLDLESWLIQLFSGDGKYKILNGNGGQQNESYYDKRRYQKVFREAIFPSLRQVGLFNQELLAIENSDLYKLSPFKTLTDEQYGIAYDILEGLAADLASKQKSTSVVQGAPGTGKTVLAVFLMKLLADLGNSHLDEEERAESKFEDFYQRGYFQLFSNIRIGIVIPQQSLRKTIKRIFKNTPGLDEKMVLSPFDVGIADDPWDLLLIDEAHRLQLRNAQPAPTLNIEWSNINIKLFGTDDNTLTQLDWIRRQSNHQLFFLDPGQSIRPADLTTETLSKLIHETRKSEHSQFYELHSQMRITNGDDYVRWIRHLLSGDQQVKPPDFGDYDFRLFDNFREMYDLIQQQEQNDGLSRLVAGYAWEWKSKKNRDAFDIEIDGIKLRWNTAVTDWVHSSNSTQEVGSIHTIQGYDLNYAGVIIGNDLRYNPATKQLFICRDNYFDRNGKRNNRQLNFELSDNDLLRYITNIYLVLLTRGMRGTYVYIRDPALREYFQEALKN